MLTAFLQLPTVACLLLAAHECSNWPYGSLWRGPRYMLIYPKHECGLAWAHCVQRDSRAGLIACLGGPSKLWHPGHDKDYDDRHELIMWPMRCASWMARTPCRLLLRQPIRALHRVLRSSAEEGQTDGEEHLKTYLPRLACADVHRPHGHF